MVMNHAELFHTGDGREDAREQCVDYSAIDFDHSPLLVFYELTQACDLVCQHCRACAQPLRHPEELSSSEARQLIDQLTQFPKTPLLVFTGGDPLKRPDLFDLIAHARSRGVAVAVTPSATPLVTRQVLERFHDLGVGRLAVSLDGIDAATHDAFRGWRGSYDLTMRIMHDAREVGLPLQVNTTISRINVGQVQPLLDLLAEKDIVLWSVFFLVPTGRATREQCISPAEYERVFELLWQHVSQGGFAVKTTEAPHYRRFVLQRAGQMVSGAPDQTATSPGLTARRRMLGVQDGKGVMFVSHTGRIYPSGFLPINCGRFPHDDITQVYQHHPLFRLLRDPDALEGKCGRCEFRRICGGSRARAYAVTGNMLGSEPDCIYEPRMRSEDQPCLV